MKILVVDDEPTIRQMARELLTPVGYDVLEAEDGRTALALARKEQPDLILLDLVMPETNGFEFILEIRRDPKFWKTPILVLSALVSEIHTDAYIKELDVAGFIDKIHMARSLISRVQEILSKQAHGVVKSTSSADSVDKAERKKILVVDDIATIRKIAGELLTNAGYHVLKAQDGEQALVLALKEHPDLIVLDLVMPEMSGIDVIREIRNDPRLKDTPILIISGIHPGKGVSSILRKHGVSEFISKTEYVTSLVSRVQEILSKQVHQVA